MSSITVLSINVFIMGHVTYQLGLEQGFAQHVPDVSFRSVHLSEVARADLPGRIAYWLLTRRLPGTRTDHDWFRLRAELANSLYLRRLARRELRARRPDVLHVHTQSIALLAADLFRSLPAVVSLDCTSALLARVHPPPALRTYRPIIALERSCFEAAAHVVCWTEFARQSLLADYGMAPGRATVIRPSVPYDAFRCAGRGDAAGRKLRLLFVGNDFVRKGGEDLCAVFRDGLAASCELDVVSNGAPVGLAGDGLRVHRGLAPLSPELLRLYAAADVFVMPTHEDAAPMVFLEAMAAGLPCIGTQTLAVPEIVGDGVRGITVPAGDRVALRAAIERLRDDPVLRVALGRAGRDFCEAECDARRNSVRLAGVFRSAADAYDRGGAV